MISDEEVTSLIPLIKHIVLHIVGRVDDDLLQDAFLGVLKARETFDAERGRSWSSWAAYKAEKAVYESLRKSTRFRAKTKYTIISYAKVENVVHETLTFEDEVIRQLDQPYVKTVLDSVLEKQSQNRKIRMKLLADGYSKAEAARMTNSDPTMTSQDLSKLRKNKELRDISEEV